MWKRVLLVVGACVVVLVIGGVLLLRMTLDAVSNIFSPPVHGSMHVYTLESKELTQVWTKATFELAWAPDGNAIWATDGGQPGDDTSAVYEVNLATGEGKELVGLGDGGYVSLAPEAGLVAYATGTQPPLSINVVSTSGERVKFGEGNFPLLREGGSLLTFLRPSCGYEQTVFAAEPLNPDSIMARGARGEDGPQGSDFGVESDGPVAASPDGRHLVYWKQAYSEDIFLRDTATGSEMSLGAGFPNVRWSPDATMFALMLRPDGFGTPETQVLAIVASEDGRILHSIDLNRIETHHDLGNPDSDPDDQELMADFEWSPDGKRIAIGVAGGGAWYPPCGT